MKDVALAVPFVGQPFISVSDAVGHPTKSMPNTADPARILIGDDHPLYREGLAQLASSLFPNATVDAFGTFPEVFSGALRGEPPELFLLDIMFPGMEIQVSLPELRRRFPSASILLVSMIDDPAVVSLALRSGADGFVNKAVDRDRCIRSIKAVLAGEYVIDQDQPSSVVSHLPAESQLSLTARQRAVLDLLEDGASNKIIARELGISHLTVRLHVSSLLRLMGVTRRQEVIGKARLLGLSRMRDRAAEQI